MMLHGKCLATCPERFSMKFVGPAEEKLYSVKTNMESSDCNLIRLEDDKGYDCSF